MSDRVKCFCHNEPAVVDRKTWRNKLLWNTESVGPIFSQYKFPKTMLFYMDLFIQPVLHIWPVLCFDFSPELLRLEKKAGQIKQNCATLIQCAQLFIQWRKDFLPLLLVQSYGILKFEKSIYEKKWKIH